MNSSSILMVLVVVLGGLGNADQQPVSKSVRARKMPPLHSSPKRDAAGLATAEQKAAMKTELEKQFATFKRSFPRIVSSHSLDTEVPERKALQRQKAASESLRIEMKDIVVSKIAVSPTPTPSQRAGAARPALATSPALQQQKGQSESLPIEMKDVMISKIAVSPTPTPNPRAGAARSTLATAPTLPQEKQAPTMSATPPPSNAGNQKGLSANAKICLTTQIYSVNKATSGVVFTQDPAYNDYFIQGCGFGKQTGEVYLSGAVSNGRIPMTVKQWGPEQIEAQVLPGLIGVRDGWPDLVVVPPGSKPAKFPNNRFYAQRQSVPLASIPQNAAHLANSKSAEIEYCPAGNNIGGCMFWYSGGPVASPSNGVDRDSALSGSSFDPGEDVYDFNNLAPGFVLNDGVGIYWYGDSETICKDWADGSNSGDSTQYSTQGLYRASRRGKNQVVVDWGVDQCQLKWLGFLTVSSFYGSGYSLTVYVEGPIGVDPWTGNPKF